MTDLAYLLEGDPDEKITWQGHATTGGRPVYGSRRTIAHLEHTEQLARQKFGSSYVVFQGAYNSTVPASAGSHDRDAAIDGYIPGVDWWEMQRFLRELGWAAWYRHTGSFADDLHIHMISLGYTAPVGDLIPSQVRDYYAHRDGLASHAADDSWHPADIDSTIFDYPAWKAALEDDMPYTEKQLADIVSKAVAEQLEPIKEQLEAAADRERRLFQNLRVILKDRFGATDAQLDEILGRSEQ